MYKNMSDYFVRIKWGAVSAKFNLQMVVKKPSYSIVAIIIKHVFDFVKVFFRNFVLLSKSLFHCFTIADFYMLIPKD